MVTSINNGQTNIYFGLSTDSYPDDAPNGSTLHEMDTASEYLYDAENNAWIKQKDGGGGGGGGGGGALVVKEVYNEATDSYALDKTVGELLDAAPNVIYVATSKGGMSTAYSLVMWGLNSGTYGFQFGDSDMFVAESTDDYPVRYSEDDPGA